jgi:hypothetical protein
LGRDRDEDVRLAGDQLGGQRGKPVGLTLRRAEVDRQVAALDVPQLGQALLQGAGRGAERGTAPVRTASRQILPGA